MPQNGKKTKNKGRKAGRMGKKQNATNMGQASGIAGNEVQLTGISQPQMMLVSEDVFYNDMIITMNQEDNQVESKEVQGVPDNDTQQCGLQPLFDIVIPEPNVPPSYPGLETQQCVPTPLMAKPIPKPCKSTSLHEQELMYPLMMGNEQMYPSMREPEQIYQQEHVFQPMGGPEHMYPGMREPEPMYQPMREVEQMYPPIGDQESFYPPIKGPEQMYPHSRDQFPQNAVYDDYSPTALLQQQQFIQMRLAEYNRMNMPPLPKTNIQQDIPLPNQQFIPPLPASNNIQKQASPAVPPNSGNEQFLNVPLPPPASTVVNNQPDPAKYSPTRVDSEEETEQEMLVIKPKTVLGKEKAKKRLLAFSMAKQGLNNQSLAAKLKKPKQEAVKKEKPVLQSAQEQFRATVKSIEEEKKMEQSRLLASQFLSSGKLLTHEAAKQFYPLKKQESTMFPTSELPPPVAAVIDAILESKVDEQNDVNRSRSRSKRRSRSKSKNRKSRSRSRSRRRSRSRKRSTSRGRRSRSRRRSRSNSRTRRRERQRKEKDGGVKSLPDNWTSFKNAGLTADVEFHRLKIKVEEEERRNRRRSPSVESVEVRPTYNYLTKSFSRGIVALKAKPFHLNFSGKKSYANKTVKYTVTKPMISWAENPACASDFYMPRTMLLDNCDKKSVPYFAFFFNKNEQKIEKDNSGSSSELSWYPKDNYLLSTTESDDTRADLNLPKLLHLNEDLVNEKEKASSPKVVEAETLPDVRDTKKDEKRESKKRKYEKVEEKNVERERSTSRERRISLVNDDYDSGADSDGSVIKDVVVGDVKVRLDKEAKSVKVRSKWDSDYEPSEDDKDSFVLEKDDVRQVPMEIVEPVEEVREQVVVKDKDKPKSRNKRRWDQEPDVAEAPTEVGVSKEPVTMTKANIEDVVEADPAEPPPEALASEYEEFLKMVSGEPAVEKPASPVRQGEQEEPVEENVEVVDIKNKWEDESVADDEEDRLRRDIAQEIINNKKKLKRLDSLEKKQNKKKKKKVVVNPKKKAGEKGKKKKVGKKSGKKKKVSRSSSSSSSESDSSQSSSSDSGSTRSVDSDSESSDSEDGKKRKKKVNKKKKIKKRSRSSSSSDSGSEDDDDGKSSKKKKIPKKAGKEKKKKNKKLLRDLDLRQEAILKEMTTMDLITDKKQKKKLLAKLSKLQEKERESSSTSVDSGGKVKSKVKTQKTNDKKKKKPKSTEKSQKDDKPKKKNKKKKQSSSDEEDERRVSKSDSDEEEKSQKSKKKLNTKKLKKKKDSSDSEENKKKLTKKKKKSKKKQESDSESEDEGKENKKNKKKEDEESEGAQHRLKKYKDDSDSDNRWKRIHVDRLMECGDDKLIQRGEGHVGGGEGTTGSGTNGDKVHNSEGNKENHDWEDNSEWEKNDEPKSDWEAEEVPVRPVLINPPPPPPTTAAAMEIYSPGHSESDTSDKSSQDRAQHKVIAKHVVPDHVTQTDIDPDLFDLTSIPLPRIRERSQVGPEPVEQVKHMIPIPEFVEQPRLSPKSDESTPQKISVKLQHKTKIPKTFLFESDNEEENEDNTKPTRLEPEPVIVTKTTTDKSLFLTAKKTAFSIATELNAQLKEKEETRNKLQVTKDMPDNSPANDSEQKTRPEDLSRASVSDWEQEATPADDKKKKSVLVEVAEEEKRPKRKRSRSPTPVIKSDGVKRLRSPDGRRDRSPSPRKRKSRSPDRRRKTRSRSPRRTPERRRRSKSPVRRRRSRSRSKSPRRRKGRSPARRRSRTPSPRRRGGRYSPRRSSPRRKRSRSPVHPRIPDYPPNPELGVDPVQYYDNSFNISYNEGRVANNLITIKPTGLSPTNKSPSPKRLTLDQRIEMELGVKMANKPPPPIQPPYHQYSGPYPPPPYPNQFENSPNFYPPQGYPGGEFRPYGPGQFIPGGPPPPVRPFPPPPTRPPYAAVPPSPVTPQSFTQPPPLLPQQFVGTPAPSSQPFTPQTPVYGSPHIPPPLPQSSVRQVGNIVEVVPTVQKTPPKVVPAVPATKIQPVPPIATKATAVVAPTTTVLPEMIPASHAEALINPLLEAMKNEREKRRKEKDKRRAERETRRKARELKRMAKIKAKSVHDEGLMLGQAIADEDLIDDVLDIPSPIPSIEIVSGLPLPNAGKGILISPGFREKTTCEKKGVKFADGVCPGESTSGNEERPPSPPKPKLPKEKRYKKKKVKTKKKVKVHIIRQVIQDEDEEEEEDELSPPPPPPGSPPPMFFSGFPYPNQSQYPVYQTQTTTTTLTTVQFPTQTFN